jgi:fibronectin type 3 domain-containing protein
MTARLALLGLVVSAIVATHAAAQETPFLVASAERGVVLRWVWDEGPRPAGYFVERRQGAGGQWVRLTPRPLTRSRDRTFAQRELGPQYDRYAGLLFPEDPRAERSDPETFRSLLLLSADVEPGVARVLGLRYDDADAISGTVYQYRLIGLTASGERQLATSGAVVAGGYRQSRGPGSLTAVTAPRGAALRWAPGTQFSAYHVYRAIRRDGSDARRLNDVPVILFSRDEGEGATIEASAIFFTDTAPPRDTAFYAIAGIDAFGRVSQRSTPVTFVSRPVVALNAPVLVQSRVNRDTVIVTWQPPANGGVTAYQVWRAASDTGPFVRVGQPLSASQREFRDPGRPSRRLNWYRITAVYGPGRESDPSTLALAEVPDLTPPDVPDSIRSSADTGRISLNWRPVAAGDLRGYRVYRSSLSNGAFALLSSTPQRSARFVDTIRIKADHPFYYRVTAVDSAFNESAPSVVTVVRPPDVTAPSAPRIAQVRALEGAVAVSWLPNPEPDLAGYRVRTRIKGETVWRDAGAGLTATARGDTIGGLAAGRTYEFAVIAIDDAGNSSLSSGIVEKTIKRLDLERPDLRRVAVSDRGGKKSVVISWSVAASAVEVIVLRREAGQALLPIASPSRTVREYVDTTVRPGRRYEYVVRARDAFGNAAESKPREVDIPAGGQQ